MRIETAILKHLIYDEDYTRKVLPFIREDYFGDRNERVLYKEISDFVTKYNANPTYESILIEIDKKGLSDQDYSSCVEILSDIQSTKEDLCNPEWIVDKTEKFCQDKAIYNGVIESVDILHGKSKTLDKGAIPEILSRALAVSFDTSVGHDYLDNYEDRFEFYHRVEERVPFDLDYFNKITKGGLPKKSLSIILAGTGTGKSLFMCHHAANCMMQGKNVLYITMEMAEEKIAERIDANLLNVQVDDLMHISREDFQKRMEKLRGKVVGKLIIKEYPTASASVTHFRNLLNELNLKKNFVPDIIFVDYMNICASSRIKSVSSVNSYTFVKSIAEEIRGLAVEFNVPVMTASQLNREGSSNSDPNMENVSESWGTAATADMMFALISTDELSNLNQIMVKQFKNRYSDPTKNKRFVIGVDKAKMKLYDLESSAQEGIIDSGQDYEPSYSAKNSKEKFASFKV